MKVRIGTTLTSEIMDTLLSQQMSVRLTDHFGSVLIPEGGVHESEPDLDPNFR